MISYHAAISFPFYKNVPAVLYQAVQVLPSIPGGAPLLNQ